MIKLLDIKKGLTTLLKSKFNYKVHFDNVENRVSLIFMWK